MVLQAGMQSFRRGFICKDDEVILQTRKNPNLTIEKLNQLIVNPMLDENLTKKL